MTDLERAVIDAAKEYRQAVRTTEAAWVASARRGASAKATERVNQTRAYTKAAHDRLMQATARLEDNGPHESGEQARARTVYRHEWSTGTMMTTMTRIATILMVLAAMFAAGAGLSNTLADQDNARATDENGVLIPATPVVVDPDPTVIVIDPEPTVIVIDPEPTVIDEFPAPEPTAEPIDAQVEAPHDHSAHDHGDVDEFPGQEPEEPVAASTEAPHDHGTHDHGDGAADAPVITGMPNTGASIPDTELARFTP